VRRRALSGSGAAADPVRDVLVSASKDGRPGADRRKGCMPAEGLATNFCALTGFVSRNPRSTHPPPLECLRHPQPLPPPPRRVPPRVHPPPPPGHHVGVGRQATGPHRAPPPLRLLHGHQPPPAHPLHVRRLRLAPAAFPRAAAAFGMVAARNALAENCGIRKEMRKWPKPQIAEKEKYKYNSQNPAKLFTCCRTLFSKDTQSYHRFVCNRR